MIFASRFLTSSFVAISLRALLVMSSNLSQFAPSLVVREFISSKCYRTTNGKQRSMALNRVGSAPREQIGLCRIKSLLGTLAYVVRCPAIQGARAPHRHEN